MVQFVVTVVDGTACVVLVPAESLELFSSSRLTTKTTAISTTAVKPSQIVHSRRMSQTAPSSGQQTQRTAGVSS